MQKILRSEPRVKSVMVCFSGLNLWIGNTGRSSAHRRLGAGVGSIRRVDGIGGISFSGQAGCEIGDMCKVYVVSVLQLPDEVSRYMQMM